MKKQTLTTAERHALHQEMLSEHARRKESARKFHYRRNQIHSVIPITLR